MDVIILYRRPIS